MILVSKKIENCGASPADSNLARPPEARSSHACGLGGVQGPAIKRAQLFTQLSPTRGRAEQLRVKLSKLNPAQFLAACFPPLGGARGGHLEFGQLLESELKLTCPSSDLMSKPSPMLQAACKQRSFCFHINL